MNAKKKKSLFDIVWDWLCSLKVNVIILILLALTSILGTIIPQGKDAVYWANLKVKAPGWYKLYGFFKATQLDDMYHSYWFIALLGLLCVTITCCSIDKFPVVWRFVVKPKLDLDNNQVKFLELKETLTVDTGINETVEKYRSFLTQNIATPTHTKIEGVHHLFVQKGLYSRFGVYVTHLSLLIIIIGALVGVFWGHKGYLPILEFTKASQFRLREGDFMELGFSLRLDGYETTYYEGTRQPKEFTSNIVVIDGGKEVLRHYIKVNHPLNYNGFTFYQSNYGAAEAYNPVYKDAFYAIVDIFDRATGKELAKNAILASGRKTAIPGAKDDIELVSFEEYYEYGPKAGLAISKPDGTKNRFWGYPLYPQTEEKREGEYKVIVRKVKQLEYTGLQVTKDPGVWTVYIGCGMMIIGSIIAFFSSHKRFWIRVEQAKEKGNVKVTFAATTNKNKETFERYFEIIKEKFANA